LLRCLNDCWRLPRSFAGTGMEYYRNVQLSPELEEAAAQVQQEVTAAIEAEERELEQMRMEGEQEELAAE
jgi:DNA-directed RNA polymerase subunit beta'